MNDITTQQSEAARLQREVWSLTEELRIRNQALSSIEEHLKWLMAILVMTSIGLATINGWIAAIVITTAIWVSRIANKAEAARTHRDTSRDNP